jgi:nucleotide-binding universal stress UspA family protein
MRKNKVLIPVDGSAFSQQVFQAITPFLEPEKNELILLRVTEKSVNGGGAQADMLRDDLAHGMVSERFTERSMERAKHPIYASQTWASVEAEVRAEMMPNVRILKEAGYEVSTAVEFGDPAEAIINYVNLHDIDLIAITTHGRTGMQRLLTGSVAEEVLRHVSVPVFMLRPFVRESGA